MTLETTTISLIEIKEYLDQALQVTGLDESENGLVVGGQPMVGKVGLAVNCSFQAIDEAIQRGCHLLITHHPPSPANDALLFEKKLERLQQSGMNLYVAHDCLDLAREVGTADALARAVRVAIQGPFAPDGKRSVAVHGMTVGALLEFKVRVGNQLGTETRLWKNTDSFGHVAIVPGIGGRPEWMAAAQELGCDTYLTGEAGMFGQLFAREARMNLLVAGHYATETPGVMALSARLARDFQVDVTFIPEEIIEARG